METSRKRLRDGTGATDQEQWKSYYPAPSGDIDLSVYDLPQNKAALEWWYLNSHLVSKSSTTTQRRFCVFASFFRRATGEKVNPADPNSTWDHFDACTWALIDLDGKNYYADSLLDHRACDVLAHRLDPQLNGGQKVGHAELALLELAQKGRVPLPDRMMKGRAVIGNDKDNFFMNLGNECVLKKRPLSGVELQEIAKSEAAPNAPRFAYEVKLNNKNGLAGSVAAELKFLPLRAPVRHGTCGIVNNMFYYYIPRCIVSGKVEIDGEVFELDGNGWYDREFGGTEDAVGRNALDAWIWFSFQLSDGSEFTLFHVVDRDTKREKAKVGVFTDSSGSRIPVSDFCVTYKNNWTSMSTYTDYPLSWRISVPSLQLELHAEAEFAHQEFVTILVTGGGFYEGRVNCVGTRAGHAVTGQGFLERKNYTSFTDTPGLLKNVGRFVRQMLQTMLPLDASAEWIERNVLGRNYTGSGTTPKVVCDALFRPVRTLTDRGGKAWRSLILVSSISALAKKYIDCSRYIALSELLHVGSLIIDDIQDESKVRRGGKCVHIEYGIPTAINAGTNCYFMAPILGGIEELAPEKQLKIYSLYFDAMRAGHAGQGLDIAGLNQYMPDVVETGIVKDVIDSLRAIHVYKTGGPAGTMCGVASIVADATDEQRAALENFGTQIGLAFQIVDDALNVRGFEGDLKEVGEDIRDGKVTYPIVKAMSRLPRVDRAYIWSVLQEKTDDRGKIDSVIEKLNSVGAVDECLREAEDLVEVAWKRVDAVVPDTLPKILMRCFCSFLTKRCH